MMAQGPCAQSNCNGGGVTYVPPNGGGSGSGTGGSVGGTYSPPTSGSSGNSGSSGGNSSGHSSHSGYLVEAAKQEKNFLDSDLFSISLFLIAAYLVALYVVIIVKMIKGKRMTFKVRGGHEKHITLSGRVVDEDDGELLDDEGVDGEGEKEVDEEKERAWREDLALIVAELDEQERLEKEKAEQEEQKESAKEERNQSEIEPKRLDAKSKVSDSDDD